MSCPSKRPATEQLTTNTSNKRLNMSTSPSTRITFIFPSGELEGRTLSISRALLSPRSQAIRSNPNQDIIRMEANSFDIVKNYLAYTLNPHLGLCAQAFTLATSKPDKSRRDPASLVSDIVFIFSQGWILGQHLEDREYQNVVMDRLLQQDVAAQVEDMQRLSLILVDDGSQSGESKLRKWFIQVLAATIRRENFSYDAARRGWSEGFVRDLLVAIVERKDGAESRVPCLEDRLAFHVEREGAEAYELRGGMCSRCGKTGDSRKVGEVVYPRIYTCGCGTATAKLGV